MSFFNPNGRIDKLVAVDSRLEFANDDRTSSASEDIIHLLTEEEMNESIKELFDEMKTYRVRREKDMDDSVKFAKLYTCK